MSRYWRQVLGAWTGGAPQLNLSVRWPRVVSPFMCRIIRSLTLIATLAGAVISTGCEPGGGGEPLTYPSHKCADGGLRAGDRARWRATVLEVAAGTLDVTAVGHPERSQRCYMLGVVSAAARVEIARQLHERGVPRRVVRIAVVGLVRDHGGT